MARLILNVASHRKSVRCREEIIPLKCNNIEYRCIIFCIGSRQVLSDAADLLRSRNKAEKYFNSLRHGFLISVYQSILDYQQSQVSTQGRKEKQTFHAIEDQKSVMQNDLYCVPQLTYSLFCVRNKFSMFR